MYFMYGMLNSSLCCLPFFSCANKLPHLPQFKEMDSPRVIAASLVRLHLYKYKQSTPGA